MSLTCNVPQAADLLKVHPETVLDLIGRCEIPAAQVGRGYVMLTSDLIDYLSKMIAHQTAERMRRKAPAANDDSAAAPAQRKRRGRRAAQG